MVRKWHEGHELLLVPGAHKCDKELTRDILEILHKDFLLTGATMAEVYSERPSNDKYLDKNRKSFVMGQFPMGEVRLDLGDITFSNLKKKAVFYITHPYNHSTGVDVETTIKQSRIFGSVLTKNYNGIEQLSLVTPVGPYDLNHSAKRNKREGLLEGRTLEMYLEDLARSNFNEIIAIGSHSKKTGTTAEDFGINFRDIDPFRQESAITPKLGAFLYTSADHTTKREDYGAQIKRLTPFVTYLNDNYGNQRDDIFFVATDQGSVDLIDGLTYAFRGDKQNMIGIIKEREGHGDAYIKGIESWSTSNLEQLEGKTCIVADDRRLSGGTLEEVARILQKKYNVGKIVALTAHDMAYNENILDHSSIDEFVFLETNPNSPISQLKKEKIKRLPLKTTALLNAAEILDSYVYLRDWGRPKLR